MRIFPKLTVLILLSISLTYGQETGREQKMKQIAEAQNKLEGLTNEYLSPSAKDINEARKREVEVFRILPRKLLDGEAGVREGGAYYSFTAKSHNYDTTSQIGLEQNYLSVGFAGANYGFIADLGEIPLNDITRETAEVNFLINYRPPVDEPEIRIEQRRAHDYQIDGLFFKNRVPAVVGKSFVLRAINFDQADVLVAFNIYRKDTDGSLIIFWKPIEIFDKPLIARNQ